MKKSVVYTKTGDKGTTALIGGTRVKKHNQRLNAYGTVDELNSFIGMIRSYNIDVHTQETIIAIQNELFVIGAYLATDSSVSDLRNKLNCDDQKIEYLELEMDQMESNLPPLSNFVLPGGHPVVAYCHIGLRATAVILAARAAGYPAVLYDGSMNEWARDPGLPLTLPEGGR